jgi:tRNA threonylcarbamoyladenosine biosynthesis protein TsaB
MLSLAIDTSSSIGSIALAKDGLLLCEMHSSDPKSHSEFLNTSISEVFLKSNLSLKNLDNLCTTIGPGSFTGLRVSMSATKALAMTFGLKIYALDYLNYFEKYPDLNFYVTANNAFKNQIFLSLWSKKTKTLGPELVNLSDFENIVLKKTSKSHFCLIGDAFKSYQNEFSTQFKNQMVSVEISPLQSRAATLAILCSESKNELQTYDWKSLQPLYLKGSEAEERLKTI